MIFPWFLRDCFFLLVILTSTGLESIHPPRLKMAETLGFSDEELAKKEHCDHNCGWKPRLALTKKAGNFNKLESPESSNFSQRATNAASNIQYLPKKHQLQRFTALCIGLNSASLSHKSEELPQTFIPRFNPSCRARKCSWRFILSRSDSPFHLQIYKLYGWTSLEQWVHIIVPFCRNQPFSKLACVQNEKTRPSQTHKNW